MSKMTFDQFRETGRDCDDLGAALSDSAWDDYPTPARGRLYLGGLWIQQKPEAGWLNDRGEKWWLLIGREDWLSDDLVELERLLFEYAAQEDLL
jgi:hypothetical protein